MERYIDSEQVVREILSVSLTDGIYGRGLKRGIDLSLSIINRQDTADVVEVVRCKDCRYLNRKVSCGGFCICGEVTGGIPRMRVNEDFCSYGERRTDNETL